MLSFRRMNTIGISLLRQRAASGGPGRVLKATTAATDDHFDDPGTPRVAITKDRQTYVLYHPEEVVKYEDTIPIPRDDPKYSAHDSLESLVREQLDDLDCADKSINHPTIRNPWPMHDKEVMPTIMHLANMFYTTKHQWFPSKGKRLRKKKNPPRDRPME